MRKAESYKNAWIENQPQNAFHPGQRAGLPFAKIEFDQESLNPHHSDKRGVEVIGRPPAYGDFTPYKRTPSASRDNTNGIEGSNPLSKRT